MSEKKKAEAKVEQDPRLGASTESHEVGRGGSYVDGQLVHDTKPRSHAEKADRGGKRV